MSRTRKDAPAARQSRRDRRFAERETPFAAPVLSVESRLAAAEFLGLAGLPTEQQLADAPCPHGCRHDAGILTLAVDNPDVRAELTAVANGLLMPRYLVRNNCEYSIEVTADSEDAAVDLANKTDVADWDQAWAEPEAELA